jgi:hypothetical protein
MPRLTFHVLAHTWQHTTPMRKAMGVPLHSLILLVPIRLLHCLQLALFAETWQASLTVSFVLVFASLLLSYSISAPFV